MAAAPALLIASTVLSAGAMVQQGRNEESVANFEAAQINREARREFAKGTREQHEMLRRGRIAESNARAQMAASGGVTDDPGAIEIISEFNRDAVYNGLAAMYSAESRKQGLETKAKAREFEGSAAKRQSYMRALSTVVSGAGSYSKMQGGTGG